MTSYFRRQLADYVEYHRDPYNCAMHVCGIVFLFLAAVLPLSLWSITVFGIQTSAATIAVVPVLVYWLLLDFALGAGILAAAIVLLSTAAVIVGHTTTAGMWSLTAILIIVGVAAQIIGHRVFERRQPALVDNPTHFLLGPMFVMAKLFIALGLRRDLAIIIQRRPQGATP
jgi:uncharacterized membrane protein YGL010W